MESHPDSHGDNCPDIEENGGNGGNGGNEDKDDEDDGVRGQREVTRSPAPL